MFYQLLKTWFSPTLIDSLFREVHMTSISDAKKEAFLEKFMDILEKRMAVKTWGMVQPDVREKIMKLSQTNELEAKNMLSQYISNLPQLYCQEALEMRKEFINLMKD